MINRSRNKGFTVIEVIISITILTLIFTLIAANVKFLNRFILRSEVDKLFSVFNYLKQRAFSTGKEQKLRFDIKNGCYEYDSHVCILPKRYAEFGYHVQASGTPSKPNLKISKAVTFDGDTVVFYPDSVVDSGTVYMTDGERNFLYAISSGVGNVGYIRKYVYNFADNAKWVLIE